MEVAVLFQYLLTQAISSWSLKYSIIVSSFEKPETDDKLYEKPQIFSHLLKVSRDKYIFGWKLVTKPGFHVLTMKFELATGWI